MTVGSSPLTRGKHQANRVGIHSSGLIPAHAGKTFVFPRPARIDAAHPRSRGENVQPATAEQIDVGSSPLTRGKLSTAATSLWRLRLIPAHAGKTNSDDDRHQGCEAHPRSRGENAGLTRDIAGTDGSSPLTRGKHKILLAPAGQMRLIPAHAGKTSSSWKWPKNWTAHPRSRGENRHSPFSTLQAWGSSPLTRGKRQSPRLWCRLGGLIPAHAGKTVTSRVVPSGTTAHPRSRGENTVRSFLTRFT